MDLHELHALPVNLRQQALAFNELKMYAAAIVGQHETHRRMVLSSGRTGIASRGSLSGGLMITFTLYFEVRMSQPRGTPPLRCGLSG